MSHDAPTRRRTGTVRRGDLPSGPPPATQRTGWALGAVLLAAVALLVGWVLGGGGNASDPSPTATAPAVGATTVASPATAPTAATPPTGGPTAEVTPGATAGPTSTPAAPSTPEATESTEPATPDPTEPATPDPTEPATPDPTEPATPSLTEPPRPEPTAMVGLAIDFPADGEVLTTRRINLIGTAAPGATITRDIPLWFDEHVVADEDGLWLLPVELSPGENRFTLRVGDDRSTERVIRVLYQPAT